jgi:hypothetical protein
MPTIVDVLMRISTMTSSIVVETMRRQASLYLQPPMAAFTAVDWARVDEMVDAGHSHATEAIAAWQGREDAESRRGPPPRRITTDWPPQDEPAA